MSVNRAFESCCRQDGNLRPVSCFSLVADADPGVMARVLQVFAKRGLVPSQWYSVAAGAFGGDLHIDIQVDNLDAPRREMIAETLRQVVSVETVLTSETRRAQWSGEPDPGVINGAA